MKKPLASTLALFTFAALATHADAVTYRYTGGSLEAYNTVAGAAALTLSDRISTRSRTGGFADDSGLFDGAIFSRTYGGVARTYNNLADAASGFNQVNGYTLVGLSNETIFFTNSTYYRVNQPSFTLKSYATLANAVGNSTSLSSIPWTGDFVAGVIVENSFVYRVNTVTSLLERYNTVADAAARTSILGTSPVNGNSSERIFGFTVAVPEASSASLICLCAVGITLRRRRPSTLSC